MARKKSKRRNRPERHKVAKDEATPKTPPPVEPSQDKNEGEKKTNRFGKSLAHWLGIAAAIATLVGTVWTIWGAFGKNEKSQSAKFYGVVKYDRCPDSEAVAGAQIFIKDPQGSGKIISTGKTLPDGSFDIPVPLKPESSVWVEICKEGQLGFAGFKKLMGSACIPFQANGESCTN